MDCPARQLCDYFTSTILLTTEVCGTIPRATIKTTNLMQWHEKNCVVKVFLLSEREISPKYTGIFLHFVHGFGSYVKGLPKTKRCNSVAVTVSVRFRFGFGVYVKQPLCFHAHLFADALWSPAGKGLTSWLSFVMSNCDVVTFPLVSLVRCGA